MPFHLMRKATCMLVMWVWLAAPQALHVAGAQSRDLPDGFKIEDVPTDHWAWLTVKKTYTSGVIEGVGRGAFQGDGLMTRGELAAALARFEPKILSYLIFPSLTEQDKTGRLAKLDVRPAKEFSDVPKTHWVYSAVHRMSQCGVIRGWPNGKLGVDVPISRYDYAVALERIVAVVNRDTYYFKQLDNPGVAEPPWTNDKPVPFKDLPSNHPAYRAVVRLANAGIFVGDSGDDFLGNMPLTRYEFAVSMARLLDLQGPFLD